jgi:hypothetical protein
MEVITLNLGDIGNIDGRYNVAQMETMAQMYCMVLDQCINSKAMTIADPDQATYKVIVRWYENSEQRKQKSFYFVNWL